MIALWPDSRGILQLVSRSSARSSVSRSPRSLRSFRAEVGGMWSFQHWQYLLSSLLWKRSNDIAIGSHSKSNFAMWLSEKILVTEFGLLEVRLVVESAVVDLGLEASKARAWLLDLSRDGGDFIIEAGLIRLRDLFDEI